jgi:hypothetical protein
MTGWLMCHTQFDESTGLESFVSECVLGSFNEKGAFIEN